MFKKMILVIAAVSAVFAFTACSSIEYATTLNDQKLTEARDAVSLGHVNAEIWGVYFLGIPLFAGSGDRPGSMVCFTDTVHTDNVVKMLTAQAPKHLDSCTAIVNLQTVRRSRMVFPIFFLRERSVIASGNAIK